MEHPASPLAAASHPDPYPYYDRLWRERPFAFDPSADMWVAAGARAASEVLASEACRVRPANEPVPSTLRETSAGALFSRLVRQRDDAARLVTRRRLVRMLARAEPDALDALAREHLVAELRLSGAPQVGASPLHASLDALMFSVPVRMVASLLGMPASSLGRSAALTQALVGCFGPTVTSATVERGVAAATDLLALVRGGLQPSSRAFVGEELAANVAGLLVQTLEASAGLIGNTLVALARTQRLPCRHAPGFAELSAVPERTHPSTLWILPDAMSVLQPWAADHDMQ
jgi:cytochrome P450